MTFKRIEPKDEIEWLEIRKTVVTATNSGAILGLNPYSTGSQIAKDKATAEIEFFENAWTWLGQELEPVVVNAVNKVLGTKFELFENKAFYVDKDLGLGATPDAGDGTVLLECKSTKPHNLTKWSYIPPAYYIMQLYTQMVCCERQEGLLAILSTNLTQDTPVLNLPLSIFKLTRDEEVDTILIKEVNRFWDCFAIGKQYRIDRKQAKYLELKLMCMTEKIL